jgi:simple sugar transport system ATP-binding protein
LGLALQLSGITKRFGDPASSNSVLALDDVSVAIEQGTIHAIVGENGAGKTTMMRCLFGLITPDSGSYEVEGVERQFKSASEAGEAGLGMVSQHYGIIPGLTTLQNLVLGAEGSEVIDRLSAEIQAEALAQSLGFEFDWAEDAERLSPAHAQKLEILKLLWRKARIMILDEPTAMLSPPDAEGLFVSLQALVARGATAILVTHRLPEVMNYCQHVTVLRGGKRVADMPVSDTSAAELASLIVGGSELPTPIQKDRVRGGQLGKARLKVQDVSVRGDRGELAVKGVSLELKGGEVVGLAGVDGSGQLELIEAIFGLRSLVDGQIEFDQQPLGRCSTADRIKLGFRILPEDRHRQAVVENQSLEFNAALGLQREGSFQKGLLVDHSFRRAAALEIAKRFGTKFGGLQSTMRTLSGGNQQRFVVGRELFGANVSVVLAMQPARGLDLAATAAVYAGIRETCSAGACALIASSDLDELLEHCDRILVLFGGKLFEPLAGTERDRSAIGRLMVGTS